MKYFVHAQTVSTKPLLQGSWGGGGGGEGPWDKPSAEDDMKRHKEMTSDCNSDSLGDMSPWFFTGAS